MNRIPRAFRIGAGHGLSLSAENAGRARLAMPGEVAGNRASISRRLILGQVVALLSACGGGGDDGSGGVGPSGPSFGTVEVTVATTGVELDPDGYTVSLETGASMRLSINGTATFVSVPAGAHDVTLSEISVSCSSAASAPRRITVSAGATTRVPYALTCSRKVILFVSNRDGLDNLYRMDEDGSGQVRLTSGPGWSRDPVWSPDGSRIAFVSNRDGNEEIYLMNADGTGVVRLTNDPGSDGNPAWAPDGTRIAFASNRGGNLDIYFMSASGASPTQLTNAPAADGSPAWSPDGTKIAFVSNRDLNEEIYRMDADGANPVRLTDSPAPTGLRRGPPMARPSPSIRGAAATTRSIA